MDENIDALRASIVYNTSAKAAVEMALWDLFGQLYHAPLYRLFGGSRRTLQTDITISVNDPETMAQDASEAAARGYRVLKIKVGGQSALDVERLTAVREAVGEEIILRADANQAWDAAQAIRLLDQIQAAGVNLSLVEQPVAAYDIEGLKAVTDARIVPVMADESVFSPRDALQVLHRNAADFLNIKLMKTGGLREAFRIADLAELYGVACGVGCMLETALCVNAAVHVACAHKNIVMIDLDGPALCAENPVQGGAAFQDSQITVSDRPGLGIQKLTHVRYLSEFS
jgi:L-alanine-DL-glutamate epimerase-like enolase superfamily enzyme